MSAVPSNFEKIEGSLVPGSVCLLSKWRDDLLSPADRENLMGGRSFDLIGSPERQKQLLHGRHVARRAIWQLANVDAGWIDAGENRIPLWPAGITGSISHTGAYAGAWVARSNGGPALGLDLQPWLTPDQAEKLEKAALKRGIPLPDLTKTRLDGPAKGMTLLFCIQESIQKCLGNSGSPTVEMNRIRIDRIDWGQWEAAVDGARIQGSWREKDELCVTFGAL